MEAGGWAEDTYKTECAFNLIRNISKSIENSPFYLGEKIRKFFTCQSQQVKVGFHEVFYCVSSKTNYDFDISVSRFPKSVVNITTLCYITLSISNINGMNFT
jgi:hypothetical protein